MHSESAKWTLAAVPEYAAIARITRHHHERWDGKGYPDGLRREEIPLMSRIVAVAEAYHRMVSNTPYRDAMPSRVARLQLAQGVESQFEHLSSPPSRQSLRAGPTTTGWVAAQISSSAGDWSRNEL